MTQRVFQILGIESFRVSHAERLVSMTGAFTGILATFLISSYFLGGSSAVLMVASMGASAVLLFAVPHGSLSQPWPLVAGHVVSAIVGVTCVKLVPNAYVAAPLAVGVAVGAMHYLRCIHPPGGATALTAAMGGAEVHALGYGFVLAPVLVNALVIVLTAVVFNYFFAWRRYPAYFSRRKTETPLPSQGDAYGAIAHEDFVYALSEIDSLIDVTEDDLLKIYNLVTRSRESKHFNPSALTLGHFYSNGADGDRWSVRQIVDWADNADLMHRKLIYKVVAGADRRNTGVATVSEFARWAQHEVIRDEANWRRVVQESGEPGGPSYANQAGTTLK